MPNYDGQYELQLNYGTTISSRLIPHRHTVDVRIAIADAPEAGDLFSDITLTNRNGSTQTLETFVLAYMAVLQPLWRPTTEFTTAELWQYLPEPSQDKTFIAVRTLSIPGSAPAGLDLEAQQLTMTFRSTSGGIMRIQLMEHSLAGNNVQTSPFTPASLNTLATFVTNPAQPFVARDNQHPITVIRAGLGQNEKLWRKRYRE